MVGNLLCDSYVTLETADRTSPARPPARGQPVVKAVDPQSVPLRVIAVLGLLISVLAVGAYRCYAFATTAGEARPAPAFCPADSALSRSDARPTVVMFAHPECACTAASLTELAAVLAPFATPPHVLIVFTGAQDPRARSNWVQARQLPGVVRVRDDGREARRFRARTSGYVVVYDERGRQRFAGGLTEARGHVGDNMGWRAAAAALRGRDGEAAHAVFGCSLEVE